MDDADSGAKRRRRWWVGAALIPLLAAAALAVNLFGSDKGEDGLLQVSGRIEGDLIAIAPRTSGRVVELLASEGDEVRGHIRQFATGRLPRVRPSAGSRAKSS